MFVIRPKKMQKARCMRSSFFLTLVLLVYNCLVTDVNAHLMQHFNPWRRSPSLSSNLSQIKRIAHHSRTISYRLDTWSQYDNPEEGAQQEGDIYDSLQSRKAITTHKTLLWPNGVINYYVDSSIVNEPMKFAVLKSALHTIMSKTCIKFVRIQEYEKLPANNWINITGHRRGCFSDLGRNAYGSTTLNLDVKTCFRTIGHAIHEMLHSLGVYHEHMRPDRNQYITIMWNNIKKGSEFNFHILNESITDYGLPYDYDSIMHYSMTAFSINRSLPTIIPMTSPVEIGQRNHMSYYDIQKLLITYNCNSINIKNSNKNNKKFEKTFNRLKWRRQNKSMFKTEVESQPRIFITHNSKSDKLEENKFAKSERSMKRFNQVTFLRFVHLIRLDNYPVPMNPMYLYIDFYFHKK